MQILREALEDSPVRREYTSVPKKWQRPAQLEWRRQGRRKGEVRKAITGQRIWGFVGHWKDTEFYAE